MVKTRQPTSNTPQPGIGCLVIATIFLLSMIALAFGPCSPHGRDEAARNSLRVELQSFEVSDFRRSSDGQTIKEVLCTFVNRGATPVRAIYAEVLAQDSRGAIVLQAGDYCVFAVSEKQPGLLPNQRFTTPKGAGFKLPPNTDKVKVALKRATETGIP